MRVLDDWELTPARAAVHLPTRTAVVADVHLGYCEARRRDGDAVPAAPVGAALAPLRPALAARGVRQIIIAGDLFETGPSQGLVNELLAWLRGQLIEIVAVIPGNHDRGIAKIGGLTLHERGFDLGSWHVIHGDGPRPAGRVLQGHEHPVLRWGNGLSAPCYLVAADHVILPAYSADAAGVNVLSGERRDAYRCYAIAGDGILDFGELGTIRPRRRAN
jgi:metallophosphoesterase superfamily enzyme